MIKVAIGAALVLGLVGYGVITPDQIQAGGNKVKEGVNWVMSKGAEVTEDKSFTFTWPEKITVEELD